MTTARYPKQVLLERIDAKIAGLADEQSQETGEEMRAVRQYVEQTERALETWEKRLQFVQEQVSLTRESLGNAQNQDTDKYKQALKLGSRISELSSSWPSAGWRANSYKDSVLKIEKKYEIKRRFLEGKRSIIESADAPDGFTMTALEKLHLLEAIG